MAPLTSNSPANLLGASFGFRGDGIVVTPVGSGNDIVRSVTVQADGRILVAGYSDDGARRTFALVRYEADGSLDTSFGDGTVTTPIGPSDDQVYSVTVQADGRIIVAGSSYNGSDDDFALVRYKTDGSLDNSFGSGGIVTTQVGLSWDLAQGVATQVDGSILVAGASYNDSAYDFALVRYRADGSLDTSFGGGDGIVTTPIGANYDVGSSISVQADGRILVAGTSLGASKYDIALARYEVDGSLDTSFGGGDGIVTTSIGPSGDQGYGLTVQADGRILVAGYTQAASNIDFALVRYDVDGSLDESFGSGGIVTTPIGTSIDMGISVTVQTDGRILVAGYSDDGAKRTFALLRYNGDGSLDTEFGGGDGIVTTPVGTSFDMGTSVTVQADGRILVAGNSFTGANNDFALVRYNGDGSLDTSFGGTNTLGGTVGYTEGGPAVVLDADVDLIDPDLDALNGGLGDYSGASLTLARAGEADATDVFAFATSSAFSLIGGELRDANGNAFATISQANDQINVSFTGANLATSALVDAVARSITYANTSDRPPASVEIDWTYVGGATATATGSSTVTIAAVNDAPIAAPSVSSRNQRSLGGESNFLFSDPDGDSLTLTRIVHGGIETDIAALGTTIVEGEYGTLTVQANGRFQYKADKEGGLAVGEMQEDSFTFTVRDPSGLTASSTYTARVTGFDTGNAGDNIFLVQDAHRAIDGGTGTDTVSFERLGEGVSATLDGANAGIVTVDGAAFGTLRNVENLTGTAFDDILTGDGNTNRIIGNGGADTLDGGGGSDRLVISSSPARIDGGDGGGIDLLFVQGGGEVVLTGESLVNIEKIYVRNDTSLDLLGVRTGIVVASQSTLGHSADITGSRGDDRITGGKGADTLAGGAGNDRIVAGSGGGTIEGGKGADKLFGGDGADIFHFPADSGRDNLYRFDVVSDRIDVSGFVDDHDDIQITAVHGNTSALITFVGDPDPTHRIIVHDVLASALTDASFLIDV